MDDIVVIAAGEDVWCDSFVVITEAWMGTNHKHVSESINKAAMMIWSPDGRVILGACGITPSPPCFTWSGG